MPEATPVLIFVTALIVAFSGAMMPGPLLALAVSHAARIGFRAGPLLVLGHGILELVLVVILVLGLSRLVGSGAVTGVIGIAGGLALVWMGMSSLKQWRQRLAIPAAGDVTISRNRRLVASGIIGSLANPYWLIWWATVGVAYLMWSAKLGVSGVASFFGGHILADLIWYSMVTFAIATGRKTTNAAAYRWLLFACGVGLVGLGGYFVSSGIRFLWD